MRNVLILGSGRSGTSMLGGTFAHAGWFVGDAPYAGRDANPKGFYESAEINGINEDLLAAVTPPSEALGDWQRWLARLPAGAHCVPTARSNERIRRAVRRAPFAYKDPRLCWTLPAWEPFVDDALRVCVFREPGATAASIVKECGDADYLRGVEMSRERALSIWLAQYRSILDDLSRRGEWLFLHFEQVLTAGGLDRIERAVGAPVSREFPDAELRRSSAGAEVGRELRVAYDELCERAELAAPRTWYSVPGREIAAPDEERAVDHGIPAALRAVDAERACVHAAVRLAATRHGSLEAPELTFARGLTRASADAFVVERLPRLAELERDLRELGGLDPRVVQRAGIGRAVATRIARATEELLEVARREGFVRGLEELGIESFTDLEALAPWPLATTTERRALAWPAWDADELALLLAAAPAAIEGLGGRAALCLRHDPHHDGPLAEAVATLSAAAEAGATPDIELEVLVVDDPLRAADRARLGRAVDLWIDLPSSSRSERAAFRSELGPRLARRAATPHASARSH